MFVLYPAIAETACTPAVGQRPRQAPSWGLYSAPQHHAAAALNCVWEHLRFSSVYCVQL